MCHGHLHRLRLCAGLQKQTGMKRRAMWRSPQAIWLCVLLLSLMAASVTSDEKQDPHEMSLKELREGNQTDKQDDKRHWAISLRPCNQQIFAAQSGQLGSVSCVEKAMRLLEMTIAKRICCRTQGPGSDLPSMLGEG